jgi:polyphenol oxidase
VFAFQETRGPVEVAFTDRHRDGALGGGPSASLDLAEPRPGDDPGAIDGLEESIDVVAYALARGTVPEGDDPYDLPPGVHAPVVVRMRQVHGADVHTVEEEWLARRPVEPPEVDGLVTALPGVALLVRVADCVPVLLADPGRGVVGAAHAGRQGLVTGVIPATLDRMRRLGATDIIAWVGPYVCGGCYEVPAEMRDQVVAVVPEAFAETTWGTPAVDVGAGIVAQLKGEGVEVVDASRCTLEDAALYSYRRQGAAAGRFGGMVWVRP